MSAQNRQAQPNRLPQPEWIEIGNEIKAARKHLMAAADLICQKLNNAHAKPLHKLLDDLDYQVKNELDNAVCRQYSEDEWPDAIRVFYGPEEARPGRQDGE